MTDTMRPYMRQTAKPRGARIALAGLFRRGPHHGANAVQNRATVDALDPPPGGAVLEIGCGAGRALAMLARSRPLGLIAGLEPSTALVARARRRLDGGRGDAALDLRVGDPGDLPFPDEWFDAVFAINGFGRWPDPERALAEMAGVLKPGGDLLLSIRDQRPGGDLQAAGDSAAAAKAAAVLLRNLGLQVRTREVIHAPVCATLLVRGRKCGRTNT